MKRFLYYFYLYVAIVCKGFSGALYMKFVIKAYSVVGVIFTGKPEYIDYNSYLDPSGGLNIGSGVVVSTNVIILTHDWSFLKKIKAKGELFTQDMDVKAFRPVFIGDDTFIGAGSIILPGSKIGKHCIVGAGAVVGGGIF